jgi:hypothetical protein
MSGKDFNLTAKESSEFPTGNFLAGFLARFWRPNQLSGQPLGKSKGLLENPKAYWKIQTNLGKFGDFCPDKSVQLLDRPSSG